MLKTYQVVFYKSIVLFSFIVYLHLLYSAEIISIYQLHLLINPAATRFRTRPFSVLSEIKQVILNHYAIQITCNRFYFTRKIENCDLFQFIQCLLSFERRLNFCNRTIKKGKRKVKTKIQVQTSPALDLVKRDHIIPSSH